MTPDSCLSTFEADSMAMDFARHDDLQLAILCQAARAAGYPVHRLFLEPEERGAWRGWWLRIDLPRAVAYCRRGRIVVGAPGAPLAGCRFVNASCRAMTLDKMASKIVLGVLGVPSPEGRAFDHGDLDAAQDYALSRRRPVCVKPVNGSLGAGVFPNLSDPPLIRSALERLAQRKRRILVEDHVPGEAARFFFIHPRVVGIRLDRPANVEGDDVSTVARLLRDKNRIKRRRTGQKAVRIGADELRVLAAQGLGPGSIPERGRRVLLREASNASLGGDSLAAPEGLHPGYAAEIERLCLALPGLRIVAVDTVIRRPSLPPSPEGYNVLELNANPGMVQFRFPWEGRPLDLGPPIIQSLAAVDGASHGR